MRAATDHPLLFRAPMIRAMHLRTKTQTRRPIKPQPVFAQLYAWKGETLSDGETRRWFWKASGWELREEMLAALPDFARWKPGRRIWARETWRTVGEKPLSECSGPGDLRYAASADEAEWAISTWRPSIFMPRWGARFVLPVVSVRAEPLLDITYDDARAEGIPQMAGEAQDLGLFDMDREEPHFWDNRTSRENYLRLWDQINPNFPSASNPLVWRIEFQVPDDAPRRASWPQRGGAH